MYMNKSLCTILFCGISFFLNCKVDTEEQNSLLLEQDENSDSYGIFAEYLLELLETIDPSTKEESINKVVSNIRESTLSLSQGEMDVNNYLEFLLKVRDNYLIERTQVVKNYLLDSDNNIQYIPPTNKVLSDWLDKGTAQEIKKGNKNTRFATVQVYEILNLFIRDTYNICEQDKLSKEVSNIISSSKQLYPIVKGMRHDVGHPDEICSHYGIVQDFFPVCSPKSTSFPKLLRLYNDVRKKVRIDIGQENDPEETHRKLFLKSFLIAIDQNMQQISGDQSALTQEILAIEKDMDVKIYTTYLTSQNNVLTPKKNCAINVPLPGLSNSIFLKDDTVLSKQEPSSINKKKKRRGIKNRQKHNYNSKKEL